MFKAMWIAISTYSILPTPQAEWKGGHMRFAILFLPLVGVLLGAILLALRWVGLAVGAEAAVFAALAAVMPPAVTGGIHMDGFMDTVDALKSWQSKERRLEIMKDPHTGAFAVMWCAAYLLLCFGLYWALYQSASLKIICAGFILSRSLCVLGVLTLPNARKGGMLSALTSTSASRGKIPYAAIAMVLVSGLCAAGMALISLLPGLCAALMAAAAFIWYRHMAIKQFGGVTGDTSGFFIQICELCVLFGAWAGARV